MPDLKKTTTPPGSILAKKAGCTCPSYENNHGAGAILSEGWGFFVSADCPLHSRSLNLEEDRVIVEEKRSIN